MRVATGSGDPVVEWSVADSNVWSLGIDNTDSDNLYLMKDSQPGQVAGNIVMKMDRDGAVTMPNQPTVLYRATAQHANVTGDGTAYTLTNFAEILDYNDDFDGQTFTAPVTGVYLVTARVNLLGLASDHNDGRLWINSSNGEYGNNEMLIGVIRGANNQAQLQIAALVDMDENDTFTIILDILGGSKTVDVNGGTGPSLASFISATLLH